MEKKSYFDLTTVHHPALLTASLYFKQSWTVSLEIHSSFPSWYRGEAHHHQFCLLSVPLLILHFSSDSPSHNPDTVNPFSDVTSSLTQPAGSINRQTKTHNSHTSSQESKCQSDSSCEGAWRDGTRGRGL